MPGAARLIDAASVAQLLRLYAAAALAGHCRSLARAAATLRVRVAAAHGRRHGEGRHRPRTHLARRYAPSCSSSACVASRKAVASPLANASLHFPLQLRNIQEIVVHHLRKEAVARIQLQERRNLALIEHGTVGSPARQRCCLRAASAGQPPIARSPPAHSAPSRSGTIAARWSARCGSAGDAEPCPAVRSAGSSPSATAPTEPLATTSESMVSSSTGVSIGFVT